MKKLLAIAAALTLSASATLAQAPAAKPEAKPAAPAAAAPAKPQAKPAPLEMKNAGVPGMAEGTRTVKETALVVAVDAAARTLTLKDKKGQVETLQVGPQVKRLEEIAAGDTLVIEYKEGLMLELQNPGDAAVAPEAVAGAARAGKDEAPAGGVAAGVRATVTVTAIDLPNRQVVLQGPQGQYHQVAAGPSIQLDRLKVGDKLIATYVQAVAISIEKAPAKAPAKGKTAKPAAKDATPAAKDAKPAK